MSSNVKSKKSDIDIHIRGWRFHILQSTKPGFHSTCLFFSGRLLLYQQELILKLLG